MPDPIVPLKEFDAEMSSTRKLLERVPSDKGTWKPHEKSFPLGHLAQLVARKPGWENRSLREPHIELSDGVNYSFEPTDVLLQTFDTHVHEARAALAEVTGLQLDS